MVSKSRVLRDIQNLIKQISRFTDGQARTSKEFDSDIIDQIGVDIKPHDGLYKDGIFTFRIAIDEYPQRPPVVTCLTNIYHPNIDPTESISNVCLNILEIQEWSNSTTLEDVVQGLLFLFYQPNLDDPLCPLFEPNMDGDEFEENIAASLYGGTIEGIEFERNVHDINWEPVAPLDTGQFKDYENSNNTTHDNNSDDEKMTASSTPLYNEDTYIEYVSENSKTVQSGNEKPHEKSPGDNINLNQCDIFKSNYSTVPHCQCSSFNHTIPEGCECVSQNGLISVNICTCPQNNSLNDIQTNTERQTNGDHQISCEVVAMDRDPTTLYRKEICFAICVCGVAYEIERPISRYSPPIS